MKDYEQVAKDSGDAPFNAQQKWTELQQFLEFMADRKPKNILEIGVYKGGTVMAWTHIAADDAKILALDLPGGEFGGGFNPEEAKAIHGLALHDQEITTMAADSQSQDTIDQVKKYGPFDFIFIDADHTYEGVKKDYENYFPMLMKGGVMAFHDITKPDVKNHPDVHVDQLWDELVKKHEHYSFVDMEFPSDWNPWGGIGAIVK